MWRNTPRAGASLLTSLSMTSATVIKSSATGFGPRLSRAWSLTISIAIEIVRLQALLNRGPKPVALDLITVADVIESDVRSDAPALGVLRHIVGDGHEHTAREHPSALAGGGADQRPIVGGLSLGLLVIVVRKIGFRHLQPVRRRLGRWWRRRWRDLRLLLL